MDHHTPEQIAKAFAYAPTILQKLSDRGLKFARFELFHDGSGCLILGDVVRRGLTSQSTVAAEDWEFASSLVHSRRPIIHREDVVGIQFCCGLVNAAEEAEKCA